MFITVCVKISVTVCHFNLSHVYSIDMHIPAIARAPPLEGDRFPVVIFSHGLSAMRSVYSMIHCDLASQGYIVAAVEHK